MSACIWQPWVSVGFLCNLKDLSDFMLIFAMNDSLEFCRDINYNIFHVDVGMREKLALHKQSYERGGAECQTLNLQSR